jgi:regulator of PEP synthase PpsR (kinase-PPPase family)
MLTAFLTQYPRDAFVLHPHHFIQTEQKLERTMDEVARLGGIVFHAVVHRHFKEMIEQRCRDIGIPYCDLTGRFMEFLTAASGVQPQPDIGRLHHVHAPSYHNRIKALEFTLEHDDGLGLETLHEADIVLTGVSRTSKTPTSIYLAQQGFRVANVSLALAVPPPRQLLVLRERVVGLTIDPAQLVEIRTHRNTSWRMGDTSYNDPEYVSREIMWSRRLFRDQGWPTINVTDRAIEETAVRIIDLLGLKPATG